MFLEASDTLRIEASVDDVLGCTIWGVVRPNGYGKLQQGFLQNPASNFYTAPATAGTVVLVTEISIVNPSGTDRTVKMWHDGSTDAELIMPPMTVLAGGKAHYSRGEWRSYDSAGKLQVATGAGGGSLSVKEAGSVVDSAATILDFLAGFDVTSSPAGEANVGLDLSEVATGDGVWTANALRVASIAQALQLLGDITPAQITANQNDYSPPGLADATIARISSDAARDITGLGTGAEGRILALVNVGTQLITLRDDSASSTAANRFYLPGTGDAVIPPDGCALLEYDSTSSRWRLLALTWDWATTTQIADASTSETAGTDHRLPRGDHGHKIGAHGIAEHTDRAGVVVGFSLANEGGTVTNLGSVGTTVRTFSLADAATQGGITDFVMPHDCVPSSTLNLIVEWFPSATDATSKAVRWQITATVLAVDDVATEAGTVTTFTGSIANKTVDRLFQEAAQEILASVNPGALIRLAIHRLGADAADTYAGAARLPSQHVRLTYTAVQ